MTTFHSSHILATCIFVILMLVGQISSQDATLTYKVREERQPDIYLGSVALESGLFTNIANWTVLQFQILIDGNSDVNYFRIEKNTSLLWTRSKIDREEFTDCYEECFIEFNVGVFHLSNLIKFIKIIVEIEDFNDNTPEFIAVKSPMSIPESTSQGEVIVSGAAIDLDQGVDNSVKSYTLLPETDTFGLRTVEIEDNGKEFELFLRIEMNRESVTSYDLMILAKDGGTPQKTGTLLLKILVTDVNDNMPSFEKSVYNTSIQENIAVNTTVLNVKATDNDEGDYGRVSYKFSNRISDDILKLFKINQSTGKLTSIGTIDFETDKQFSFEVIAFDHGEPSKSSSAIINIKVTDVNDNSPIIILNQPPGGTVISELDVAGSFVLHLEIIDLDSGKNGHVICNILDSNFMIKSVEGIENNYKVVLNKTLDHDKIADHNVTILCQDTGDLPRQTFAHFIVHVEDINDNAPEFQENVYSVSLEENNQKGASILYVSAMDNDSGDNGAVSYSLHSEADGLFKINSFTGVIRANASIDREKVGDQVIFRVFAKDGGKPALTSTGTVVINIKDLNDNDPIFVPSPMKFNVSENMRAGTQVGNITADDPDSGLNGTFYFKFPEDPDILEYFSFHESGLITTNKEFDREKNAFHQFFVHAIDMGGRSSSTLVIISVTDVNDNYPEIIYPNEYDDTIRISYSLSESLEVIHIEARDYDNKENAQLYYYIDQDNASYAFILDVNSGSLVLNRSLHEKNIGDIYHFVIKVKDGGDPSLSTWTQFNIHVISSKTDPTVPPAAIQPNLWIVVGIVIFTAVLSVTMIIVMVKICWFNRRKGGTGSTSDIIMESNEVDSRYVDSSSAASTLSKDSNSNVKIKDGNLQIQDGYQKGFYGDIDETDYITNSSLDNPMYLEHVKKLDLDLEKKLDESVSDNSGELGTRDSGQGGSDLDNISLSELPPPLNLQGSMSNSSLPNSHNYNSYHRNHHQIDRPPSLPSNSLHSNTPSDLSSDRTFMPTTVASFSQIPAKTAERKELSKLRTKSQKRVMFSDDLENSHSSGRSSILSTQSYVDSHYGGGNQLSPRRFNRMLSEDSAIVMNERYLRANDWLRRSADNLSWQRNNDKVYNQLPSNQIKFGDAGDYRSKPMGSNIKTYLDKVLSRTRHNSLNESQSDTRRQSDSFNPNELFMTSDSGQGGSSSRDAESTTTSGSYHLGNGLLNLDSPRADFDDVFANDIEI